ncbi:four-carbon acid sugar kinase family protein [Bordetella genomosp. 13]|uniref:four-carbon acid sugar kinase family protein n=1 Tax=Bordetella genomosp. 13 TaxID=463040 RepID=UPI0011A2C61E|nr:four-carbon acid sugar kinase family protein [Bordetella genomosp. 13]
MAAVRIAYYGDDFTGSTDTLSVAVRAGLRAALFLRPPTDADLRAFGDLDCVGVAGTARSWPPEEMDRELPTIFGALAATGAEFIHYKTCSTFDSAPHVGSIGRALQLGLRTLGQSTAFIVGGQPGLGRYCAHANLYARAGQDGPVYRLDRHPTMSRHPITPMDEADLRVHLARQGLERVASFGVDRLPDATPRALDALLADGPRAVLFDVLEDTHLAGIGRLLWDRIARQAGPLLLAGPSGVEQALVAGWPDAARGRAAVGGMPAQAALRTRGAGDIAVDAASGLAAPRPPSSRPTPLAVAQTFVVAGSRSPVTAQQVRRAQADGFALLDIDPVQAARQALDAEPGPYCRDLAARAVQALQDGRSVVANTTLADEAPSGSGSALARFAGQLMRQVLRRHPLSRVGFAGGDTSSLAVQAWDARALTLAYTLSPGVAVCKVHADDPALDGVELMLKGGQMGPPDVFEALRQGRHVA